MKSGVILDADAALKASEAEVERLRAALVAHRVDLHQSSTRPCATCQQSAEALGRLMPCPECSGRGYVTFSSTSKYGRIMIECVGCQTCWGIRSVYEGEAAAWRAVRTVAVTGGEACCSTSGR
ncbi:MAG: hypothetical protein V2A73_12420 [Pseudomonadota bacterium]